MGVTVVINKGPMDIGIMTNKRNMRPVVKFSGERWPPVPVKVEDHQGFLATHPLFLIKRRLDFGKEKEKLFPD